MKLKKDLDRIIDKDYDYVSVIKVLNQSFFEEEHIGKYDLQDGEMFI
jgi:CRISPR/Cas system-associated endoribonuclease Cas2